MLSDDDLINIFQFLKRKDLDKLQMVSYQWHKVIVERSKLIPKMYIHSIQLCVLQETQFWSFFSPEQCVPLDNYENLTSHEIIDKLIMMDENMDLDGSFKFFSAPSLTSTCCHSGFSANSLWSCRICGQQIGIKFDDNWFYEFSKNESTFNVNLDVHMQNYHNEFYENIKSKQFIEKIKKLNIPCILIGADNAVDGNEFSFFCYAKMSDEILNQIFVFLSNCFVNWLSITIMTSIGWSHLIALFNLNGLNSLSEQFNFSIYRLNIMSNFDKEISNISTNENALEIDELTNFFTNCSKIISPQQLFTKLPYPLIYQIKALQNSRIFPTDCKYLDIQQNPKAQFSGQNETDCLEMLEAMIFADYSKMNKKTIKWQKLYWMRYGSELDNLPGTYSNSSYGEWAISSIAIYPIEPSVKFVQNCVKIFLTLETTNHLIGRRIRLYKNLARNCQQINKELYEKLKNTVEKIFKMECAREGEYFARNKQTGDNICLLFRFHGYNRESHGSAKITIDNELKNSDTEYERGNGRYNDFDYCPFKNSFILEFPYYPIFYQQ